MRTQKVNDLVNKAVNDACEIALKQPLPGKQLVLMTDAGFKSAGYTLMTEDNPDEVIQSKRNPMRSDQKIFHCVTQVVHLLERVFSNVHGISRVCTHSVADHRANNCPDRQLFSHTFLSIESNPNVIPEGFWLCVAIQFRNSTHNRLSQQSSWLSF